MPVLPVAYLRLPCCHTSTCQCVPFNLVSKRPATSEDATLEGTLQHNHGVKS